MPANPPTPADLLLDPHPHPDGAHLYLHLRVAAVTIRYRIRLPWDLAADLHTDLGDLLTRRPDLI